MVFWIEMKTVLFSPGYMEDIDTRDYRAVLKTIEDSGYDVKFIPIVWKRTTIDDWVAQLEDVYHQYDPQDVILAGFSYGSMTSFVVAAHENPAELWLFSLSPYFREDMINAQFRDKWLHNVGKHRTEAFLQTSFDTLAQDILCPVKIFIGSKEIERYPTMELRALNARRKLNRAEYIIVPDATHDVALPEYRQAIKEAI